MANSRTQTLSKTWRLETKTKPSYITISTDLAKIRSPVKVASRRKKRDYPKVWRGLRLTPSKDCSAKYSITKDRRASTNEDVCLTLNLNSIGSTKSDSAPSQGVVLRWSLLNNSSTWFCKVLRTMSNMRFIRMSTSSETRGHLLRSRTSSPAKLTPSRNATAPPSKRHEMWPISPSTSQTKSTPFWTWVAPRILSVLYWVPTWTGSLAWSSPLLSTEQAWTSTGTEPKRSRMKTIPTKRSSNLILSHRRATYSPNFRC